MSGFPLIARHGALGGTRTLGPRIRIPVLCPLSYGRMAGQPGSEPGRGIPDLQSGAVVCCVTDPGRPVGSPAGFPGIRALSGDLSRHTVRLRDQSRRRQWRIRTAGLPGVDRALCR